MFAREIRIRASPVDFDTLEEAIESAFLSSGLKIKLKTSLSKYPDSIHWHLGKGKESGTLEVTLWKQGKRAWFSVQRGRDRPWVRGAMRSLKAKIETT